MSEPIEVYYWPTPNGHKITIALEEMGLPYKIVPVNIGRGDQFKPEFLAIGPNNRMPAIIDPLGPGGEPISVFESGAILQYLGRKTGRFYPGDERARVQVDEGRLRALWPEIDLDVLRPHLEAFPKICAADASAGPIAALSPRERFHWLVAPRSTLIQVSPVHSGLCDDPEKALDQLFERSVTT